MTKKPSNKYPQESHRPSDQASWMSARKCTKNNSSTGEYKEFDSRPLCFYQLSKVNPTQTLIHFNVHTSCYKLCKKITGKKFLEDFTALHNTPKWFSSGTTGLGASHSVNQRFFFQHYKEQCVLAFFSGSAHIYDLDQYGFKFK